MTECRIPESPDYSRRKKSAREQFILNINDWRILVLALKWQKTSKLYQDLMK